MYIIINTYICSVIAKYIIMNKPFVYGMSVEGENFTDPLFQLWFTREMM